MVQTLPAQVLARFVLAALVLASNLLPECFAQCDPEHCGERSTGQGIKGTIEWDFGNMSGQYHVYRKTSVTGTPSLQAVLPKTQKVFATTMPSGKIKEYRYFYVPVELTPTGAVKTYWSGSEEILILRTAGTRKMKP